MALPIVRISAPAYGASPDAPPGEPSPSSPSSPGRLPAAGWPDKADLDYIKVALELTLLILAVPYIVGHLARSPGTVVQRAGRKQLPPS